MELIIAIIATAVIILWTNRTHRQIKLNKNAARWFARHSQYGYDKELSQMIKNNQRSV